MSHYVHIFFCHGHGHVICMDNLGGNNPEGHRETHKSKLFPYKQVGGRNNDLE